MNNGDENQTENSENRNEMPEPAAAGGFCRPPEPTRFKKGISGNPKGRPKGSLNIATVFMKSLREKVVINEHGQRKIVTKMEAAFKQLANKAAGGDLRALALLRDLAREAEEKQKAAATQQVSAVGELDQEVMQGILQRFQQENDDAQQCNEGSQPEEEDQDGRNE